MSETVTIRAISAEEALEGLGDLSKLDPRGAMSAKDMGNIVHGGRCFALGGAVDAVYVLKDQGRVCWVEALKGSGRADVTAIADGVMTEQARGFEVLAMQTARPGLRKKLEGLGWKVTGWVMQKGLIND